MADRFYSDRDSDRDRDKNKQNTGNDYASSRRFAGDKFLDSDYHDESFELEFKTKGSGQPFAQKKEPFKVNIPDFDDIPVPEHIPAPDHRTPKSRTPQGKRIAPGTVHKVPTPTPAPTPVPTPRPAPNPYNNRTPRGARIQPAPSGSTGPSPRAPKGKPIKKGGTKAKAVLGLFCVLFILVGAVFIYGYSALGGLGYDKSITENRYLDESTLVSDQSVRNILFIGSDAREGLGGQRSDSMILFSIDNKNHKIKLTSFMRDSYVYIPSKGYNTKLNAAFNYGGAQLLMETLEYNFGVEIDEYVMINYDVFIELVDLLGGITINDVTEKEAKYMRDQVNRPKFKAGTNHVDGRTAMWYCRIRYVDNDFRRTERQRKVLTSIISKATKTNPFTLVEIVKQVLPNISTNLNRNNLLTLGMGALIYMHYDILQQQVPAPKTWSNARVNGQDVLKLNFEKNREIIKEFIYE